MDGEALVESENLPIDPELLEKIKDMDYYMNELIDIKLDIPNFTFYIAKTMQI